MSQQRQTCLILRSRFITERLYSKDYLSFTQQSQQNLNSKDRFVYKMKFKIRIVLF